MSLSTRTGGTAIVVLGLVLSAFHVRTVGVLWGAPARVVVNGILPLVLAAFVVAAGVQLVRNDVVADQFVTRVLSWVVVGVIVLAAATAWLFASVLVTGPLPANATLTLLNASTLGGLIGYLVGVYDARRREQQVQVDQLNRINNTLRIATREIVNADTRNELEQQVCERLQQSKPYESAWIGRYDPEDSELQPDAWAGLDDEYYESVVIAVDGDDAHGKGAGGRAVRTGEIQCSQNVSTDPSMEPWRELFAEHGVESVAVVPLVDGDTVHGILSVYADRPYVFDEPEREVLMELGETIGHAITSLEAREQLRRRERELASQNDRLEEFASVVSHDLRNPMNVAEGSISLEREDRDSDALQRAADALTRMNELVEDILALARTGQLVSEFDSVDLRTVVEDAWATTETEASTLDAEPSLGTISGDESRIRELFENLFRNAIEHADDDVTVSVGNLDDADGFYVADDGPGISPADRETVFDVGYSTNPDGTGFGLNIVRSIADAHGWDVTITESDAGGTRFEFSGVETDTGRPVDEQVA
ncbi:GAF domain-containing protein [Halobacterium sp. KA-4]|uniref:receiver/sensor box histidine kinase n=1 Tax=Halobacterium sp. KA-4 TaxID=2896367 RepID=UPI001E59601D|nr:GAF domain-containing protein [Halobacterium sp. KA-4]MCD2201183.1 GAF domain-containing protein [Halobacterium sp. KA-4]